jgi:hypothetical protein
MCVLLFTSGFSLRAHSRENPYQNCVGSFNPETMHVLKHGPELFRLKRVSRCASRRMNVNEQSQFFVVHVLLEWLRKLDGRHAFEAQSTGVT